MRQFNAKKDKEYIQFYQHLGMEKVAEGDFKKFIQSTKVNKLIIK